MEFRIFYFLVVFCAKLIDFTISSPKYEHISDCSVILSKHNLKFKTAYGNYVNDEHVTFNCAESGNDTVFLVDSQKFKCSNHPTAVNNDWAGTIDFKNCRFPEIKRNFFVQFPKMHKFIISNVELETLQIQIFREARHVTHLNASTNRLKEIPSHIFFNAVELIYVDFSNNTIDRIDPSAFAGANKLESLDLSQNVLESLDKQVFKDLPSLKLLNVSHNKIDKLDSDTLSMPNLIKFDLSFNPIGELNVDTFSHLANLEDLNLMRTDLTSILMGTFSHMHNLISLDLSDNNLKEFDFNLFLPFLHNIRSFHLDGNQLTELNGFGNNLFPKLQTLDIRNNNFNCSYLAQFIKSVNWEKIQLPVDLQSINSRNTNIRGIKCEVTVENKLVTEATKYESNLNEISSENNQTSNDDIVSIKISLIFICIIMSIYLYLYVAVNRNEIFRGCRKFTALSSTQIMEYSNEIVINDMKC